MIERIPIPFVGGAYAGRSTNINAQICRNLYPVMDQEGGKISALMNTPGLDLWAAAPSAAEVRGLHLMGDYLLVITGNALHRYYLNGPGSPSAATGNLATSTLPCFMEDDGTNLMILDYLGNGHTYTIAGHTLTAITDADFPAATKTLTYQDGYFIVNKQDTGRFYISALKDPTSWDALDYATAEAYSDQLMVVISTGRELWLLGRDSYEIWYNSGASDFPFARMSGGVFKGGCGARYSVVAYGNRIFMRGTDGSIKMSEGYQFKTISTPQVNFSLPAMDQSLAGGIYSAFCYSQEGHDFYVLNSYSTTAGTSSTWVYDITTGLWHERRSGSTNIKWRGNCGLYYPYSEKIIVGDPASGVLYALNLGTYTDYAAAGNVAITRVRAAQAVYGDRKNIFHAALELEFEAGGSVDILLQWSDDGGSTYNTGITKSTGATRTTRIIWRRLGRSRDRIYKLTTTTAAKFVLIGAWLEAEVGAA